MKRLEEFGVGDLIQYRFGKSVIVGVCISKEKIEANRKAFDLQPLFSVQVLEFGGRLSDWEVTPSDIILEKLKILEEWEPRREPNEKG